MNAEFDVTGRRIETDRLVLRPFEPEDLEDFYAYAKVEGVGECAGWPHHESIEGSRKILEIFLAEKKTYAVVDKASERVIGSLGIEKYGMEDKLTEFDGYRGREIGYVLAKDCWGQGLMTEALDAVVRDCFENLGYDFLLCGHFDTNPRSGRVMEKCGFVPYRRLVFDTILGTKEPGVLCLLTTPARKIAWKFSHPETLIYADGRP